MLHNTALKEETAAKQARVSGKFLKNTNGVVIAKKVCAIPGNLCGDKFRLKCNEIHCNDVHKEYYKLEHNAKNAYIFGLVDAC